MVLPEIESITLNETEDTVIQEMVEKNVTINGTKVLQNVTVNKTISTPKVITRVIGAQPLGIAVAPTPTSNLRKGLDLQGGIRVLLRPDENITEDTLSIIIESLKQRLNVYGLSDIVVTSVTDLSGSKYILVELAGATEQQAKDLLSRQGKFEATVGNETVFRGGNDITYVCRTAQCSGIDPNRGCSQVQGGYGCSYFFSIALSAEAATLHADITKDLAIVGVPPETYLSENLTLYLDNVPVRTLRISSDLRGTKTQQISISGFGTGTTLQEAQRNTLDDMKQMQTVLVTGSLPTKLSIAKMDTISPTLGASFVNNALLMGVVAAFAVALIILLKYRKIILAIPIMLTLAAEVLLTIGAYALFGWSFDISAIAGIIVAVGTGVNDQIVMTDETLRKQSEIVHGWKAKLKNAFFIILAAASTNIAAMLPLLFAGAGLLRGFAITTIIGILFGITVTRPAYGAAIEILLKDQE
jgi:preprotein translocase subunit SecD